VSKLRTAIKDVQAIIGWTLQRGGCSRKPTIIVVCFFGKLIDLNRVRAILTIPCFSKGIRTAVLNATACVLPGRGLFSSG